MARKLSEQPPSTPPTALRSLLPPPHPPHAFAQDSSALPPTPPSSQVARAARSKGVAGIRAPRNRPALRDAFIEPLAQGSSNSSSSDHCRNRSNSHELSWPPNRNVRVSVVDNMLASLDHSSTTTSTKVTSTAHAASTTTTTWTTRSNDNDLLPANQRFATLPAGRSRGNTTSSSASSDYGFVADSPQNRGHRSNSGTNYQSSLGRIDSVRMAGQQREEEKPGPTARAAPASKPLSSHGRARAGSKSSGSSSIDLGYMGNILKWQRGFDQRPSSFDHEQARPAFLSEGPAISASPLAARRHRDVSQESIEAAPLPTVPSGPRRNGSIPSAFRPGSSLSNTMPTPARRRGSIRSPMAIFNRPEKGEILDARDTAAPQTPRAQRRPDIPPDGNASTTPETLSTQASQNRSFSTSTAGGMHKEKDKPGFFKRVFGSSRNQPQLPSHEGSPSQSQNTSGILSTATPRGIENTPPGLQNRRAARPAHENTPQKVTSEKLQSKEQAPPSLNKKSSFFRRRKKSVSEANNVPVPSLPLHSQWQGASEQDPMESLRQAMDPYLNAHNGSRPPTADNPQVSRTKGHHKRDDSFGRSTIRAVQHTDDEDVLAHPSADLSLTNTSSSEERSFPLVPAGQPRISSQTPRKSTSSKHGAGKYASRPDETPPPKPTRRPPSPIKIDLMRRTSSNDWMDTVAASKATGEHMKPKSSPRLWIATDASDDEVGRKAEDGTDPKTSVSSLVTDYQSAHSKQTSPFENKAGSELIRPAIVTTTDSSKDDRRIQPTAADRIQAHKLFDNDSDIPASDAAAWLGEAGDERTRARKAYMDLFDWKNMSILAALRNFCNQLRLKGESQQVDRLLDALSCRWCECNPEHGFIATDVVHTICYSLLLLNTDLHLADIDSRMTKGQFVKNTMPTIRRVVADAAPNAFVPSRGSMLPPPKPAQDETTSRSGSPSRTVTCRPTNRLTTRPSDHSGNDTTADGENVEDCALLVDNRFHGKQSAWESQIETILKDFYHAIRQNRLPLVKTNERRIETQPSSNSLSAASANVLRRNNSILSKAGSESLPARGRLIETRTGSRWSSKTRSRPRIYQASLGRASRTSIDDDMSAISPSASSMWSKYSLGKTQTSMSVNSYSSEYPPRGDYQRSIGFANALSQAIIREDAPADAQEETMRVIPLLEDESLELAGAPWAKEGLLKHKHHLESVEKKAKDRNWSECFAVVDKGWMRMFQFNASARSMRQKARNQKLSGGVVGGGNWTENAESLGKFSLRQTIASALPPPGYSRTRPHVFALSLPNGAVHLFQAGTPEIVREFVSAANYWSARMSKEPLVGGVSNIEYGWSEAVINMALVDGGGNSNRPPSSMAGPRPSLQSSIRGSIDQAGSKPKLPGDRIAIHDWSPPTVSMMESQLLEVDQLRALSNYVKSIEEELAKHQELRPAISLAFSPRHPNAHKAMNNWERKSSYLLREIVKFRTYIDSLQQAQVRKEEIYRERDEYEKDKQRMKELGGETMAQQQKEIDTTPA